MAQVINNVSECRFTNTTTGETISLSQQIEHEVDFKQTKEDKVIYKLLTIPTELDLSLTDCVFDKDALLKMLEIDPDKSAIATIISNSITREEANYLNDWLGFTIYPMRKAKSVRVQNKWNKIYGFRAVNKNVDLDDCKIDFDKKEMYL